MKISALTGAILAAACAGTPASAAPIGIGADLAPPAAIEKTQIVNGRDYTHAPYVGRPVGPGAGFGGRPRFGGPGYGGPGYGGPGYGRGYGHGYGRGYGRGHGYGRPYGYGRPHHYGRRDYY